MKKVFMTIFAAALAMSMSAGVTPHYGIELGYDYGSARIGGDKYRVPERLAENLQMNGFHVGGNVQLDFLEGKHIPSLVIGLNYQFLQNDLTQTSKTIKDAKDLFMKGIIDQQKAGINISNPVFINTYTMHTIQLPIRGQYAYQINNDWSVFAFTGPQLRFHVALQSYVGNSSNTNDKKNGMFTSTDKITGKSTITTWLNGEKSNKEGELIIAKNRTPWFDMSWGFGVGCAWKNLSLNVTYDLGLLNLASDADYNKYTLNSDALAVTVGYRF